ncbi:hypothetical protein OQH61_02000 [Helicobacter sp. MIT 21-1697]|uniref:hypothetical protein n=1 Tax=Helicobacter sp. MIT 21-1697 TaxID=2993733 RepID=UPI00224A5BE2|nr:hypothetical protein [Helicobacter sp. MIT 21-1697]MCX2716504.1 hypothetical protein [Helicobacter sp. MIT 21-1697]
MKAKCYRGGGAFFAQHKPVIMIEIWQHNQQKVFGILKDLGYVCVEELDEQNFVFMR